MKKGFTLIELLAVIVILSVIALIATPLILNVIEESRNKAALLSTNGHIEAIEKDLILNSKTDGQYDLSDLNIEVTGEKAKNGYVVIEGNKIKEATFCIGKITTEYNGKESKISKNDYCSEDYEITLIINGEKETKKIGTLKETEITLSDISGMTNIGCNNGTVPIVENNTLKLSHIYGDTTCVINSTLKETFNKLDETENNILMLTNESVTNILEVKKNQNVTLDLNGKEISTNQVIFITNNGILNVKSSKDGGVMTSPSCVLYSRNNGIINIYSGAYINTATANDGRATIVVAHNGTVNIYGNKATFNDDNEYVSGTYLEGNENSISNIGSDGGTVNIYNGTFKMKGAQSAIRSNAASDNIVYNIYDGEFNAERTVVSMDSYCLNSAKFNLYGGTFISKTHYAISNGSPGTINIVQTDKPIYISTKVQEWKPAIGNGSSGIINISGNKANACTNNYGDTTSGLCVYAEGDGTTGQTGNAAIFTTSGCTGNININGGTYYGGYVSIINPGYNGNIINIRNAELISNVFGIGNNRTGIVKICNSTISSANDMQSNHTALIEYSSDVIFSDGTNTPYTSMNGTGTVTRVDACSIVSE